MGDYITKVKQLLEAAGIPAWQHCRVNSMLNVSKCLENKTVSVFGVWSKTLIFNLNFSVLN
jgi:hypothetical protein